MNRSSSTTRTGATISVHNEKVTPRLAQPALVRARRPLPEACPIITAVAVDRVVAGLWAVTNLRTRFEEASSSARRARSILFSRLLASMPKPLRILDIGGTYSYWQAVGLPHPDVQIELFNLSTEPVNAPFTSIAGDARDLSRYSD